MRQFDQAMIYAEYGFWACEKGKNLESIRAELRALWELPQTEDEANERADNGRNTGGKSYR